MDSLFVSIARHEDQQHGCPGLSGHHPNRYIKSMAPGDGGKRGWRHNEKAAGYSRKARDPDWDKDNDMQMLIDTQSEASE